jgi:hypothetical protein
MFFFEKKNQKTFNHGTRLAGESATALIKVFCFFSSEKKHFLLLKKPRAKGAPGGGLSSPVAPE